MSQQENVIFIFEDIEGIKKTGEIIRKYVKIYDHKRAGDFVRIVKNLEEKVIKQGGNLDKEIEDESFREWFKRAWKNKIESLEEDG